MPACSRCRQQKLRCSQEKPKCSRCERLSAECLYPPPANYKLGAQRAVATRRRAARKQKVTSLTSTSTQPDRLQGTTTSDEPSTPDYGRTQMDMQLSDTAKRLLVDICLTCTPNASLIVHRPSFEQDLVAGNVPQHALNAIYAMATTFLPSGSERALEHHQILKPLGDLEILGRQYAVRAGTEILLSADQPDFAAIQTCLVLVLYWLSVGESQRNTMFSGIAYRALCTMVSSSESISTCTAAARGGTPMTYHDLFAENVRRCFWASWIGNTVNADHYIVGASADSRVLNMPLPISEQAFNKCLVEPSHSLTEFTNVVKAIPQEQSQPCRNVRSELIYLVWIWAKARDCMETRNRLKASEAIAAMQALEHELQAWWSGQHLTVDDGPLSVLTIALYHQCRLVLHASIVPYFGGTAVTGISDQIVIASVAIVVQSAISLCDLAQDLLTRQYDPSRMAPFVGYCMYAVTIILAKLFPSPNEELKLIAMSTAECALQVLKSMKPYWKHLDKLWARANLLHHAATSSLASVQNNGINRSQAQFQMAEFERIARMNAAPGKLDEELLPTLFQYSLRKVEQWAQTKSLPATVGFRRPAQDQATAVSLPTAGPDSLLQATAMDQNQESANVNAQTYTVTSSSAAGLKSYLGRTAFYSF